MTKIHDGFRELIREAELIQEVGGDVNATMETTVKAAKESTSLEKAMGELCRTSTLAAEIINFYMFSVT
ncbi:MAG: hypothetical protein GY696_13265 [Gammaproteobacteria bacterium]|nr:hypothetical protein [Gammaproteobacteria bacterium]